MFRHFQEVRTEAVFQTPDPVFDRTWVFVAPSYDSVATIDLVDAATDRPVGRLETSIIALLQVQATVGVRVGSTVGATVDAIFSCSNGISSASESSHARGAAEASKNFLGS